MPIERITEMTLPLWGLWIFIAWTMFTVVLLFVVRGRHLMAGGSPRDFANPDSNELLWRMFRVQANCVENLPLYAGAVLLLEVRGIANSVVDGFAIAYISFRILHSLIHIFGWNPNFRAACLGIQFICLLGLMVYGLR